MPEYLQISLDLATSVSIIFAALVFVYQQWKENKEKKELGLWKEIKGVIDSQGNTLLESIKLVIQLNYNASAIKTEQKDSNSTLEAEFTQFLNIISTVKYRVRLDSKPKIEALLKRHKTYYVKKDQLDKIFEEFDNECDALIKQMITVRRGASKLSDRNIAVNGMVECIVGDAFLTSDEKAAKASGEGNTTLNLNTIFNNFSEKLLAKI